MNKNGVIGVGVLLVFFVLIGGIFIKVLVIDKAETTDNTKQEDTLVVTSEKNNFTFRAEYKEGNTWAYEIKGEIPSPCHSYEIEPFVLESYPEQVSVVLTIRKPSEETICTEVIKEIEETGTFTAGNKAKISFLVTNM